MVYYVLVCYYYYYLKYIPGARPNNLGLRIAGHMWRRKRKLLTAEYFVVEFGPNFSCTACCKLWKISRSLLTMTYKYSALFPSCICYTYVGQAEVDETTKLTMVDTNFNRRWKFFGIFSSFSRVGSTYTM